MDIFETYIKQHKRDETCRALTCKSYKQVYQNNHREQLDDKRTNTELATYGDALIKFVLCELLLDKEPQLSEKKKEFEEDKFFIEVVAKHYNLLDYMNFDRDDANITKEYVWHDNNDSTKYIATTVEAVVGALYQENHDFDSICKLIENWKNLK